MTLISKIFRTIHRHGIRRTLAVILGQFADIAFDLRHRTDTIRWRPLPTLEVPSPNKKHGNIYQATTTPALKRIFADIRPLLPAKAGLLDIGSGKGKVLLVAADFRFTPIRGIEFSRELCEIAGKNADIYFRKKSSRPVLDIIEIDAADYKMKLDEHVFFFFNPFNALLFSRVTAAITDSLAEHPRPAFLVYNNPEHRSVIDETGQFSVFREYVIGGNEYLVYRHNGSGQAF